MIDHLSYLANVKVVLKFRSVTSRFNSFLEHGSKTTHGYRPLVRVGTPGIVERQSSRRLKERRDACGRERAAAGEAVTSSDL